MPLGAPPALTARAGRAASALDPDGDGCPPGLVADPTLGACRTALPADAERAESFAAVGDGPWR